MIVTNEGNADLTASLPGTHIVVTGIEKVVPTLDDRRRAAAGAGAVGHRRAAQQLHDARARAAAGGRRFRTLALPRRARRQRPEPPARHATAGASCDASAVPPASIIVPVYTAVGGHAYGSVYSGPMGAVLTPALAGLAASAHLPNASTFCGRCEAVCPVAIPIPKLLRHWRERALAGRLVSGRERRGLGIVALARRASLGLPAGAGDRRPRAAEHFRPGGTGRRRRIRRLPAGGGWTAWRDLPAPEGETFQERWRRRAGGHPRERTRGDSRPRASRRARDAIGRCRRGAVPPGRPVAWEERVSRFTAPARGCIGNRGRVRTTADVADAVADYLDALKLPPVVHLSARAAGPGAGRDRPPAVRDAARCGPTATRW